jgi:hypothetical protein
MIRRADMNLDSDKVFINFALLKEVVSDIDNFELAIVNSDLKPDYKVAINKILTAVQNCNFYGD